jgi:outer membrane protein
VSKTALTGIAAVVAIALAAPAITLASPAAAQQQQPPPSPEHVKALIQQAMTQTQTVQEGVQVTPATQGAPVNLTADEAVARALERNLTLASQRLTPRTFDFSLAATRANYRPVLTSTLSNNSQTSLSSTTVEGGLVVNTDTQSWNSGVQQNVPWGGGNYSVTFNNSRDFSTRTTGLFNPTFGSTLRAQYVQPLLQNFKIDNTRTQLGLQTLQQQIADLDLRATVASTVAQVRNTYWELVFAYQQVEASQRSLELAAKLVSDNKMRVEIGTMAPIDVVQAQAEEASRRTQLVNSQTILRNSELALKQLIVGGTDDELWNATINPVDRPSPQPEPINLESAVTNALQNRTDLATSRKNIESTNVTLRSLKNQTLPGLNLVTIYQLVGRGGTSIPRDGLDPIIRGGYWDALGNIGTFDAPTWTLRLDFSYPIGQSVAEANVARQQIILQQNQTQIKTTELQIATEVTGAALSVTSALEGLQAAAASRELSERRLEAAQSKFEVGMATNFEVVQAQRDLNDARNSELRQLLNYRRALVDLERVQISPR